MRSWSERANRIGIQAHRRVTQADEGQDPRRAVKTALAEWAYARPYRSNDERLVALPRWVDFYNHGRPHTALGGLAPMQELVNKRPWESHLVATD